MDTRSSRRSLRRIAGFALRAALACLALVAMAGAGAQTVSLKTGGERVSITVGDATAIPADFPTDVALPADAKLVRTERTGTSTVLEFSTTNDVATNLADLDARLRAGDWQPARVRALPGLRAQAWEKDQRALIAWASEAPGAQGAHVWLRLVPRHARAATTP